MTQGIQLMKAITALRLQAGVMAEGVAEAVATEQQEVVKLLAALPSSKLPAAVQLQLRELGVQYDATTTAAAEDFDIPEVLPEELLQLGKSNNSKNDSRDLLQLASYLNNTADLGCVLEHRDDMAAVSTAATNTGRAGSALLSKTQATMEAFGSTGNAGVQASRLLGLIRTSSSLQRNWRRGACRGVMERQEAGKLGMVLDLTPGVEVAWQGRRLPYSYLLGGPRSVSLVN
jgi:hypothetical protein